MYVNKADFLISIKNKITRIADCTQAVCYGDHSTAESYSLKSFLNQLLRFGI